MWINKQKKNPNKTLISTANTETMTVIHQLCLKKRIVYPVYKNSKAYHSLLTSKGKYYSILHNKK